MKGVWLNRATAVAVALGVSVVVAERLSDGLAVMLLASSLGDILWFELTGAVPLWLLWGKVSLLGALILLSWLWKPIKTLRPFSLCCWRLCRSCG
jgi:hypothetical protein